MFGNKGYKRRNNIKFKGKYWGFNRGHDIFLETVADFETSPCSVLNLKTIVQIRESNISGERSNTRTREKI